MRKRVRVLTICLVLLLSAGCDTQSDELSEETLPEIEPVVSVTGEVLPSDWAGVSVEVGGMVADVLVEAGDDVAAGDVLLRVDSADAQLAVRQAEAAVGVAEAELAVLQAGPRVAQVADAEARVQAARAALAQAVAERNQLTGGALEADIAAAEEAFAQADAARKSALIQYEGYRARADEIEAWSVEHAALLLRAAEQRVEAARIRLARVEQSAGARLREADAAVNAAEAEHETVQAQMDFLLAGATPQQIAVAQTTVAQAEADLAAAQVTLDRTELRAPIAGTVGEVTVRAGETVSSGQPVLTLGELSTLRVETTDLDEIDVARVRVGQVADVTFDALPESVFRGRVTRISPLADPGAGGVQYTVIIEMDELAPAVRWGMTAFVDIAVE